MLDDCHAKLRNLLKKEVSTTIPLSDVYELDVSLYLYKIVVWMKNDIYGLVYLV